MIYNMQCLENCEEYANIVYIYSCKDDFFVHVVHVCDA